MRLIFRHWIWMSAWRHEALVPIGSSAAGQTHFPLAAGNTGDPTVSKQGVLFPYAVRYTGSQRGLAVAKNSPEVGQEKRRGPGGCIFGIDYRWQCSQRYLSVLAAEQDRQAVSLCYDVLRISMKHSKEQFWSPPGSCDSHHAHPV